MSRKRTCSTIEDSNVSQIVENFVSSEELTIQGLLKEIYNKAETLERFINEVLKHTINNQRNIGAEKIINVKPQLGVFFELLCLIEQYNTRVGLTNHLCKTFLRF